MSITKNAWCCTFRPVTGKNEEIEASDGPRHRLREVYPYVQPLQFVPRGVVVRYMTRQDMTHKNALRPNRFMEEPGLETESALVVSYIERPVLSRG